MNPKVKLVHNTTERSRPYELKIIPENLTRRHKTVYKDIIGRHGAYHFGDIKPRELKTINLAAEFTKAGFDVFIDGSIN